MKSTRGNTTIFTKRSTISCTPDELFAWHNSAGALMRLNPPWDRITVVEQEPLSEGSKTRFYLNMGPLRIGWVAGHTGVIKNREFTDFQIHGPFSYWRHRHRFDPDTEDTCVLDDTIHYRLKLHPLGTALGGKYVARKLEKMFAYRHAITSSDIGLKKTRTPINIALTGASGFIGASLVPFLQTQGHSITRLVRCRPCGRDESFWDADCGVIECSFGGADAVIHLAGEPIGEGAWTRNKMKSMIESRVAGTRLVAEKLAAMERPPRTFLCASAIGYYGNRGGELLHEDSAPGSDYISEVCREWERAARPAADRGIRVVFLRIGVVLHPGGGALKRYLAPARIGMGSIIGDGGQYISWISMEDLVRAIDHMLFTDSISGPVNLVAPEPATNREFIRELARIIGRPAPFTLPAPVVRMLFGRMGREVLLSSTRVSAEKLIGSGFRFRHEKLEEALKYLLGR